MGELKKVVTEILWTRQYVTNSRHQFPQLAYTEAASAAEALRMLSAPADFFMKTRGPDRDPTWLQSLPNEASRCFMKHMLEVPHGVL